MRFMALSLLVLFATKLADVILTIHLIERTDIVEINPYFNANSFWGAIFSPAPSLIFLAALFCVASSYLLASRNILDFNTSASFLSFAVVAEFVLALAVLNNAAIFLFDIAAINSYTLGLFREGGVLSWVIVAVIVFYIDKMITPASRYLLAKFLK